MAKKQVKRKALKGARPAKIGVAKKKSVPKKSVPKAKGTPNKAKSSKPRSFSGVVRGRSPKVRLIANRLREIVFEELPDVQEDFYGGNQPMSMYRTTAEVCWIQPLKERCNIYFMRGPHLTDTDGLLEGSSDRQRFARVPTVEEVDELPIRDWIRESVELNSAATSGGMSFDEVLQRLRTVCLALPNTKETITWGKPHFRVGEKIFCSCSEDQGRPRLGLKMELAESKMMMRVPGIEKAPYSRKDDGWVTIDPLEFDDWEEIERVVVGSFRLIAPKRTIALLDD